MLSARPLLIYFQKSGILDCVRYTHNTYLIILPAETFDISDCSGISGRDMIIVPPPPSKPLKVISFLKNSPEDYITIYFLYILSATVA